MWCFSVTLTDYHRHDWIVAMVPPPGDPLRHRDLSAVAGRRWRPGLSLQQGLDAGTQAVRRSRRWQGRGAPARRWCQKQQQSTTGDLWRRAGSALRCSGTSLRYQVTGLPVRSWPSQGSYQLCLNFLHPMNTLRIIIMSYEYKTISLTFKELLNCACTGRPTDWHSG